MAVLTYRSRLTSQDQWIVDQNVLRWFAYSWLRSLINIEAPRLTLCLHIEKSFIYSMHIINDVHIVDDSVCNQFPESGHISGPLTCTPCYTITYQCLQCKGHNSSCPCGTALAGFSSEAYWKAGLFMCCLLRRNTKNIHTRQWKCHVHHYINAQYASCTLFL
jgi:hypothetical protein